MLKGETHQYFWMKTKQGRRHQCDVTSSSVGQLEYPLLDQTLEAVLLQWFEYVSIIVFYFFYTQLNPGTGETSSNTRPILSQFVKEG